MQAKPEDLAWAAGLFEGEGTWGYQPNSVRAELAMTDFEPVERFHKIIGVGRLMPKKIHFPDRHSPALLWRVTDRAGVEHVLEALRPWLCARRIARGEEVLRLQAEFTAASKQRQDDRCKNGHRRTAENTAWPIHAETGKPYRSCRVCARDAVRRYRRERRARLLSA